MGIRRHHKFLQTAAILSAVASGGGVPSLDGTPQFAQNFFGTSAASGTLTTTAGSGVIHVAVNANGTVTIPVPTAPGLTFTQRSTTTNSGVRVSTFTAPYATNFSGVVTVTCSGTGSFLQASVIAVGNGGAFDANASVPNVVGSGDPTITTSNANDFLIYAAATTGSNPAGSTGFTAPFTAVFNNFMVQFQIVTSTGTFTPTLSSGGPAVGAILDAIT